MWPQDIQIWLNDSNTEVIQDIRSPIEVIPSYVYGMTRQYIYMISMYTITSESRNWFLTCDLMINLMSSDPSLNPAGFYLAMILRINFILTISFIVLLISLRILMEWVY